MWSRIRIGHVGVAVGPGLLLGIGTATASHLVVRSSDIVDGQVKTPDLAAQSVTTGKLKTDAVTGAKVDDDTLTGADILEGSLAKVPNADAIDGLDSTALVRGPGRLHANIAAVAPSSGVLLAVPDAGAVRYTCTAEGLVFFDFHNNTTGTQFLVDDQGGDDPTFGGRLAAGAVTTATAPKAADHIWYHLFPTDSSLSVIGSVISIEVAGFDDGATCAIWAQATVAFDNQ